MAFFDNSNAQNYSAADVEELNKAQELILDSSQADALSFRKIVNRKL